MAHGCARAVRLAAIVAAAIIVVAVGVFLAIAAIVTGPVTRGPIAFRNVYDAADYGLVPRGFEVRASDGLLIRGFEVEVESPKAVVVFISGTHNPSVTAFFGHARMMRDSRYASVLFDMRARGASEGTTITLGYHETRDAQAVVEFVRAQERYRSVPIVLFGLSMGGAVAITATGQDPGIAGVISVSAFSSWEDVFVDNMAASGFPSAIAAVQRPFVKLYTLLRFGPASRNLYASRQIARLAGRPAFIMHSTADSQVPFPSFERIVEHAGTPVETWAREGDMHLFTTDFLHPGRDEEYARRLLDFMARHFG